MKLAAKIKKNKKKKKKKRMKKGKCNKNAPLLCGQHDRRATFLLATIQGNSDKKVELNLLHSSINWAIKGSPNFTLQRQSVATATSADKKICQEWLKKWNSNTKNIFHNIKNNVEKSKTCIGNKTTHINLFLSLHNKDFATRLETSTELYAVALKTITTSHNHRWFLWWFRENEQ